MSDEHQLVVAALRSPEAYVLENVALTGAIEVVETHVSLLFFTDEYVYKIKKPVDVGFADFTTLASREANSERELALNRRMSSDVYLEVLPVTLQDGRIVVGGDGEVVDYAVKMRRLSHDWMLDKLIEKGVVTAEDIRRVARQIAIFHANADRSREITRRGGFEALVRLVEENFSQTQRYVGRLIDQRVFDDIVAYSRAWLGVWEPVMRRRERETRVRDGHGDLHASHVWLDHLVQFIDCLEFSADYRYGDVALDLAFLAMDLDHFMRADLGAELVDAYVEFSKDVEISELLPFLKCYRAFVRAKVASLKLENAELDAVGRVAVEDEARSYYGLAHAYAMDSLPERWLFAVMGLSGTGKSTLAKALGDHWGLPVVSSDVERKRIAGLALDDHSRAVGGGGLYSHEMSERTYEALFDRAAEELRRGSVILDATFSDPRGHVEAGEVARRAGAQLWLIEITATDEVVRGRLEARANEGADASDATWDVYVRQRDSRDRAGAPGGDVSGAWRVSVDGDAAPDEVLRQALEGIFKLGAGTPSP